jgi:hypothetical protein
MDKKRPESKDRDDNAVDVFHLARDVKTVDHG